ncbi:DgyrCDS1977 [Dimorphilus gyrociliatus]|uniref:DgyrCDS1977 n=1 Tax=Dimorphilus gyrociliatus TaxID=2664684 RepID=A0A7I8VA91_9ANNE|nr:DgyrCDS1977 [Dimorphilus gyrociliatus]
MLYKITGSSSASNSGRKRKSLLPAPTSLPQNSISTTQGFKIGDRVRISGTKSGILKYFGKTKFAQGEWCGIELDEKIGKNNGSVEGVTYFNCEDNFGIFAPVSKVTMEKKEEVEVKRARQNQSSYQSRLSMGLRSSKLRQNQTDSKDKEKSVATGATTSESKVEKRTDTKGKKKNTTITKVDDPSAGSSEDPSECRDKFPPNIQSMEKSSDVSEANAILTASTDTGYQDDVVSSMHLSAVHPRSITSSITTSKEHDQLVLSSDTGYQCDLPPLTQSKIATLQDCPVSLVSSTDTGYQGELSPNINSNNATFTIVSDAIDKVEELETEKEKDKSLKEEATVDVIQMSHHSDFSVSVDFSTQQLEVTYDVIQMQHESSSSSNDKENCIGKDVKHSSPEKPKKTAEKKTNSLRKPQVKTIPKKDEKPIPKKSSIPPAKNPTFKRPSVPPPKVTTKKPVQIPVVKRTSITPKVPPIKLNSSTLSDNSSNASFTRLKTSTPVKKDAQNRRLSLGISKETPTLKQRNINNSTTSVDSQASRNSVSSRGSFSTRNTSKGPPSASSNTSISAAARQKRRSSMPHSNNPPLKKEDHAKIAENLKLEKKKLEKILADREKMIVDSQKILQHSNRGFSVFAVLLQFLQLKLDESNCDNERIRNFGEAIKTERDELYTEIEQIKNEFEEERTEISNNHHLEITELQDRITELESLIEDSTKSHQLEIQQVKVHHQNELQEQEVEYKQKLQDFDDDHNILLTAMQSEHENIIAELHATHETKLSEMAGCFETIKINLSEKVDYLRRECEDLRNREKSYLQESEQNAHMKVQSALAKYKHLPDEIRSLKAVLDMKNEEISAQRQKIARYESRLEELEILRRKVEDLKRDVENKQAIIEMKAEYEKDIVDKHQKLLRKFEKESKANKRLSMNNEELEYKLRCYNETTPPGAPCSLKRSDTYELLNAEES